MQTDKLPYEVLIRFGVDGAVQGAHVIWAYRITDDDGQVVGYTPGNPLPAGAKGDAEGFPLSAAVGEAIAAAIEATAPKLADYDALLAENEALIAELAEHQKRVSEAASMAARLEGKNA